MSLLLSRLSRLRLGKHALVRRSSLSLLLTNGFSSSLLQTPPCFVYRANSCGEGLGKLLIRNDTEYWFTHLEKKVPLELVESDPMVTIGASHGWIATLQDNGFMCLQDDLNPFASYTDPKRIPLPPFVTLPHCQTQIVTNVSMSSSSPEEEDCVVAVKFLGPQLSFCRPAQNKPEWTNIKIENPCFFSSRVIFSKKDDMFRIPGSGGHLIGSWGLSKRKHKPKFQRLRYQNLPDLTKIKRELLDSCLTSEHLVESRTTGETFLVKWFRKTSKVSAKVKTRALMVFKIDDEGNAVYTQDIGDLVIYLSKSEPFCVPASSFPGLDPNMVEILDADEDGTVRLDDSSISIGKTVVAVKFLGPQISFCRPAQSKPEWTNIKIENSCFSSSRVMFSKKDEMFLMPGSGGHLIGSWHLRKHKPKTKIQRLRFRNLPELTKTKRELLHSCWTSEHLVESRPTGETFLVKQYKKTAEIIDGIAQMRTKALMVFKLDEEGNAVYTNNIWNLCIFLSKSEPFCLLSSSFPGLCCANKVKLLDVDEKGFFSLYHSSIYTFKVRGQVPYYIPPQNIE